MAPRFLRLFDDRDNASLRIDLCNAVSFRVVDRMQENGRALVAGGRFAQMIRQAMTEEHIVAEHECRTLTVEELGADDKGLGKTSRLRLLSIGQIDAPVRPVAEKTAE